MNVVIVGSTEALEHMPGKWLAMLIATEEATSQIAYVERAADVGLN